MKHYAGLDVSVKESAICIMDETGKVCREVKVVSHRRILSRCSRTRLGGSFASGSKPSALTMAVQRSSGGRFAGCLHRDSAHEGFPQSSGE